MPTPSPIVAPTGPPFLIGSWLIDPKRLCFSRSGEEIRVEPKVMEVLLRLAQGAGEVVTREVLLSDVWPDAVVTDDALTLSISKLRKALGDSPRQSLYIETIPKTGYRLLAPVSAPEMGDSASAQAPLPTLVFAESARETAFSPRQMWILGTLAFAVCFTLGIVAWSLLTQSSAPAAPHVPTPLTSTIGREIQPALSPDGSKVAYAWAGPNGDNWDIYIQQVGSDSPLRLTNSPLPELRPVWSGDGQHLAFIRYDQSGCRVFVSPLVGGSAERLISCGTNDRADLTWSPNGQWFVYPQRASLGAPYNLILHAVDSGEQRPLTAPPAHVFGDTAPIFSPDGTTVAFKRSRSPGVDDIFWVSLDDTTTQRITHDNKFVWGLTWDATAKHIVFSSNRAGLFNLWQIDRKGQNYSWIQTAGNETVLNPTIASATNHLVFEHWTYDSNIWKTFLPQATEDTPEPEPLIASTQWDVNPQYSPDGNRIAFMSRRSGNTEIWVSDADGTNPLQLTQFASCFVDTPRWSPDGHRLVFVARPDVNADLFMVDAQGGPLERVTETPWDETSPNFSPDGQAIIYARAQQDTLQLWQRHLKADDTKQLTYRSGRHGQFAPDGSLYFTKPFENGLWHLAEGMNQETLLLSDLDTDDWGNWTLTETGIYFIQRPDGTPTLAFFQFKDGSIDSLMPLPADPQNRGLALSRDGTHFLHTQMDRDESDLMLLRDLP